MKNEAYIQILEKFTKRYTQLHVSEFSNIDKMDKNIPDPSRCRGNKNRFSSVPMCTEHIKKHTQDPGGSCSLQRGLGGSRDTHRANIN